MSSVNVVRVTPTRSTAVIAFPFAHMDPQQQSESHSVLLTVALVLGVSLFPLLLLIVVLVGGDVVFLLEQSTVGLAAFIVYFILLGAVDAVKNRVLGLQPRGSGRLDVDAAAIVDLEEARADIDKDTEAIPTPSTPDAHSQLFEVVVWLYASRPRQRLIIVGLSLLHIVTTLLRHDILPGALGQSRRETLAAAAEYIWNGVGGGVLLGAWAVCARLVYRRLRG
ncbi:hypothetical protein C8F01DRAFT_1238491 [Mycena amicta]|nr:hypothetical protein C8F01DRAFT_1238491 [Mycena amicta]